MNSEHEKEFYNNYIKHFLPRIELFEKKRQKVIREIILTPIVCVAVSTVLFVILASLYTLFKPDYKHILDSSIIDYKIFVAALAIFCSIAIAITRLLDNVDNFKKFLKMNATPILAFTFADLKYWTKPLKEIPFERSNLFCEFDEVIYDDCFQGKYKGTTFDVQEVKLQKGKDFPLRIFKGIAICIPTNKTINARTIITTKGDLTIKKRNYLIILLAILLTMSVFILYLINVYTYYETIILTYLIVFSAVIAVVIIKKQIFNPDNFERVKLEDSTFNKYFDVFAESQIDSRYLITPTFMERLKNLQTAFGTQNIKCSFFDDKIMFAISTNKDLFEFGNLFTPMKDSIQVYKQFAEEIASIYYMIDHFKLNEKTGL